MLHKTTIRNTGMLETGDGLAQDDIDALQAAEATGELVLVDCEACDGYYDITMQDGREIAALSWWHLDGMPEPK